MSRLASYARSPFGSAVLGGLVVAILGWVAIAAGWIESEDSGGSGNVVLPISQPAPGGDGAEAGGGVSVSQIYDRTSPGVAHIEATGVSPQGPVPFGGPAPRQTATGSGFVIDEEGRIVTNAHVVDGASEISVKLGEDEKSYEAELVGEDASTDIAVLRVDAGQDALEPLALGESNGVDVGDPVVAIGNPFGLDRTATAGIVSALQREIQAPNGFTIRDVIQTDAAINPGNSGGPLLDATGRVVGVNSQIESSSGGNVGIGFAVPIDTAREVAQQLISNGEVQHAYMGITGADLTSEIADVVNMDADAGALVQSVVPGSPADEAGIEAGDATVNVNGQRVRVGGDLIVAVDGRDVQDMGDVISAVDSKSPGDELELTLLRGGDERTVSIELTERPASTP